MRKSAHHCELQLSNYRVCNFQFKTYVGSCVLGRFSSECQATMFLQRIFYSKMLTFRHSASSEQWGRTGSIFKKLFNKKSYHTIFFIPLGIHFWCVSDIALHWNKCLPTIKLTKKWLTSPIEAFHVEKSPKKGTKVFAEGIFLCVLWRIFFWPGQGINVQRIRLQSLKAVPFSYLEFLPKEGHSTMMDRHSSSPKSFLSRPP